jgi:DNA-binding XRE family transcriptional regulator
VCICRFQTSPCLPPLLLGTMAVSATAGEAMDDLGKLDEPGDEGADPRKALGRRISDLRRRQGLTQAELASRSGIHRNYLASLEAGNRNVGLLNLVRIAQALDIPTAQLFPPTTDLAATDLAATDPAATGTVSPAACSTRPEPEPPMEDR